MLPQDWACPRHAAGPTARAMVPALVVIDHDDDADTKT